MERTPSSLPNTRSNSGNRCIPLGVGSRDQRSQHGGSVVNKGAIKPHQSSGIKGRSICGQGICKERTKCTHPPEDGQSDSDMLHQSHGRYKVTQPVTHSLPTVAVVPSERDHSVSRTFTRKEQCNCRPGVSHHTLLSRVDAGQSSVQQGDSNIRAMLSRPLCFKAEQPTEKVRQLAA